ncbi:hypothetical protein Lesp01_89490 [Lentzea sp. NBRC 102530]|nr:hypothetical protein Lesp01_89490 [Lentzea sp. NBRC 102530]
MALALVAAAVLVLSDSARMLRLAVVAALWAALVGAFLAAKYRKQVTERDDEVADLQSVYELELEREVAARREYELEIESETRKRIEEESRADIEALRADLHALRDNLQALLGGDVLVERVALRAESTRLRSLASEASRLTAGAEQRIINAKPAITASPIPAEKPSERTELIERVAHEAAKVQAPRREPARPEPVRPERVPSSPRPQPAVTRREPVKAAVKQEPPRPQQRPGAAAASVSARLATPSQAAKTPPPTVKAQPVKPQPVQAQAHRTERVQRPPAARAEAPAAPKPTPKPVETRQPRVAERTEMIDPKALQQTGGGRRRADDRSAAPAPVQDSGSWETLKPDAPTSRRRTEEPSPRRTASEDSLVSLPPVGRRSASEQSSTRLPAVTPSRRPADEPSVSGRRVAEDSSTRLPAVSTGRRAAPEDPSGAHADGKSVSELLASLGGGDAPRRRRRRDD